MNNPCGLYLHIPFCSSKCLYCDFFSKADNSNEISVYIQHMLRIIKNYGKKYSNKIFDTIYIGGGTPSVIGTENLIKIISAAKSNFNMITPEITIEMNPNSALNIDFNLLANIGVNRISLGVQSSNESELKVLGRTHKNSDVVKAVKMIKNSGINNVSLDLMVGISEQDKQSLQQSIDFCISQQPTHISAYILKVEDNTPYKKLAPNLNLPDDDKQAELYEFMRNYLTKNGYEQYEISNFAKKGFESRHNIKYWNCDEYLGLGASAHSMIEGKRFYFPRCNNDFYNNKIIFDGAGGTAEEYIMLRLRLKDGLYFKEFENIFGFPLPKNCISVAKKYMSIDLTEITNEKINLTLKGFLVSNTIIAEMLE